MHKEAYRVAVVGMSGVGKSGLVNHVVRSDSETGTDETQYKTVNVKLESTELEILDIACEERFHTYRGRRFNF